MRDKYSINEIDGCDPFLLDWFPTPANHDGSNYVFSRTNPKAIDTIIIDDTLTGIELLLTVGKAMTANIRPPIHLEEWQASELHSTPHWALWCGRYSVDDMDSVDPKVSINADHNAVYGVGVDVTKELDVLISECKAEIRTFITEA